jgi:hypothetical protein
METAMTHRDPNPDDEPLRARRPTGRDLDATQRTTPRQALWSAITAVAVVIVLFVVFYGINSQRDEGTATTAKAPATTAAPTTIGQSGGTGEKAK